MRRAPRDRCPDNPLDAVELLFADDGEVGWSGDDDPLRHRLRAVLALAGDGVAEDAEAAEDDAAGVEVLAQQSPSPVIGEAAAGPHLSLRGRDCVAVEVIHDLAERLALFGFGEDAADDGGLLRLDAAQPCLQGAFGSQQLVSVDAAPRYSAVAHGGELASADLVGELLQVDRIHRPLEADVERTDSALGDGDKGNAVEGEELVDRRHVGLVAADTREVFYEDRLEVAVGGVDQQALDRRTAFEHGAGDRLVRVFPHHRCAAGPGGLLQAVQLGRDGTGLGGVGVARVESDTLALDVDHGKTSVLRDSAAADDRGTGVSLTACAEVLIAPRRARGQTAAPPPRHGSNAQLRHCATPQLRTCANAKDHDSKEVRS